MEQNIKLKYLNPELQIGMVSWRRVYLLYPKIIELNPEFYKGRLIYRQRGSVKRISYSQIKNGLKKKELWITIDVPSWAL